MDTNLDDVGRLEEYIIFYSENYFRSLREFYMDVALEKPIMVVYEGGDDSVVAKVKDECKTYCTEKYLNEGIDKPCLGEYSDKRPYLYGMLKAGSFSAEH